jgi:elongator complex protein 6
LAEKKKFEFIDGLSGLLLPKQQKPTAGKNGTQILSNLDLASISREIQTAIRELGGGQEAGKVLLIVDQLDLLLAAGGTGITSVNVGEMLMFWREV